MKVAQTLTKLKRHINSFAKNKTILDDGLTFKIDRKKPNIKSQ